MWGLPAASRVARDYQIGEVSRIGKRSSITSARARAGRSTLALFHWKLLGAFAQLAVSKTSSLQFSQPKASAAKAVSFRVP